MSRRLRDPKDPYDAKSDEERAFWCAFLGVLGGLFMLFCWTCFMIDMAGQHFK